MADARFEILHLDDQPELVAWIPRAVGTWFWKNFTDDLRHLECDDAEDDPETEFVLHLVAAGEHLYLRYRIFKDPDGLLTALAETDPERVILILLDQAIGENLCGGSDTYRTIAACSPALAAKAFLHSAYPNLVCKELGWSVGDPRVIIKPVLSDVIIPLIVDKMIEQPGIAQLTRERVTAVLRENEKRMAP